MNYNINEIIFFQLHHLMEHGNYYKIAVGDNVRAPKSWRM